MEFQFTTDRMIEIQVIPILKVVKISVEILISKESNDKMLVGVKFSILPNIETSKSPKSFDNIIHTETHIFYNFDGVFSCPFF